MATPVGRQPEPVSGLQQVLTTMPTDSQLDTAAPAKTEGASCAPDPRRIELLNQLLDAQEACDKPGAEPADFQIAWIYILRAVAKFLDHDPVIKKLQLVDLLSALAGDLYSLTIGRDPPRLAKAKIPHRPTDTPMDVIKGTVAAVVDNLIECDPSFSEAEACKFIEKQKLRDDRNRLITATNSKTWRQTIGGTSLASYYFRKYKTPGLPREAAVADAERIISGLRRIKP